MDIDEFKQRKVKRGYVWLKLFTDLVDEPEFMQLTDKAKAVYFEVYILAGRSDAGGLVTSSDKPARIEQLAWSLRRSGTDLQTALDELQRAGLVNLDGDQVTVCRFGSEQGPSADEKRAQWREWQRESRAKAKGEKLPDVPDQDQNTEPDQKTEKNQKQKPVTDQDQTQTKRVSQMSGNSQGGVMHDTASGGVLIDFDTALKAWNDITGLEYKPGDAFSDMVKDWQRAGVTVQNVRDAITQANGTANTPLYVAIPAKNLHTKETAQAQSSDVALERFRKLYREQKQTGGDNGIHE